MDLLGLGAHSPFPGVSLAGHWEPPRRPPRDVLLSELTPHPGRRQPWRGPVRSLVAHGWHYIQNADGTERLYDFDRDRLGIHDLAHSDAGQRALDALRTEMRAAVRV
jgi:hypothetical protein